MATNGRVVVQVVNGSGSGIYSGGGTSYLVQASNGALYMFYPSPFLTPVYKKSIDNGLTWSEEVVLKASVSCTAIAVWADWWSGITATAYIHVAYTESTNDDTYYRTIDTANSDTLGTERTVFAGSSTAGGGALSVCRARGGNVMVATCIDAGAEYDTRKTVDLGVNWTSPAEVLEGATTDQVILAPGWAADNQDMMAFFWDADADAVSVKYYDDSGDSWSETSLATSMVDTPSSSYPHFSMAVDLLNSQNILVAWSGVDTANADLRCWKVTQSAQTEVTNVVLNSTDDQGLCSIAIDTVNNVWFVAYCGKSDGSETWNSSVNLYYKVSTDAGTNWSAEILASPNLLLGGITFITSTPQFTGNYKILLRDGSPLTINLPAILHTRANFQLGM